MKRAITISLAVSVIVLALFASSTQLTNSASAQSAEKKQLFTLTIMHVKPELLSEYENFLKNELNPLLIKGGVKARYVWWPDRGDRVELIFIAPMENYAVMNQPDTLRTVLGSPEAVALIYQKQRRFLNGQEVFTIEANPDISWTNPKLQGQPRFALMRWQTVVYGRSAEYEDFFKNYEMPARRKTADQSNMLGQWRFRVRFGGDVYRYLMLRPMASYGELDEGGTKGLGQILGAAEYQKMLSQLPQGVIVHDEAYLIRFRAELSIVDGKSASQ